MDAEARFRALYAQAYGPLRRWAQHRGIAGADADDVVAEVFTIAWRRSDDIPDDAHCRPGRREDVGVPDRQPRVDGQFYLQDGTRWVKDTNAAGMSGDDVFSVDPRRFLSVVAQDAQFTEAGTDTVDGVAVRHLTATRLDAIPDFNLGPGPTTDDTQLTAFELWVDTDDVVRGLLVATEQREQTYPGARARLVRDEAGHLRKEIDPATVGDPVVVTTTQHYKVDFTDIGEPIGITAPVGAVSVAGKG